VIFAIVSGVRGPNSKRRSDCSVSISLERFGDRWWLLIIRDLMVRAYRSFKEFEGAGQGIAMNILADRLQRLEAAGSSQPRPRKQTGAKCVCRRCPHQSFEVKRAQSLNVKCIYAHNADAGKMGMRKVIVSNLMSLDGFFESPDQKLDWCVVDEEFFEYAKDMLRGADTLLFGRKTYQHMAKYWPTAPADEIENQMNNLPKLVFSRTLQSAEWKNSTLVKSDAAEEISKLKQLPGKDMVILGSASLLASLLRQRGLIDEYRVILNPVFLGSGKPLFQDVKERLRLKLSRTKLFGSGVVVLYYQSA